MKSNRFEVVRYTPSGEMAGVMSGMGRNAGTWDSEHSRSAAYRHARDCRRDDPSFIYKVEHAQ